MAYKTTSKNNISSTFENYIQNIYNNNLLETFDKIKQIQNFIGDMKSLIVLTEQQLAEFQDSEEIKNILNSPLHQIFTYMSKKK